MIRRNIMYVDAMLAQLNQLCKTWRDECGQNLDQVQAPISEVVFDVLKAIGVPDNGISMVLAVDGHTDEEHPLPCNFCPEPAWGLAELKNGEYALVCPVHASHATQHQLPMLPWPQGQEMQL